MIHNGIEYGDMQLISEVYDILKVSFPVLSTMVYRSISFQCMLT